MSDDDLKAMFAALRQESATAHGETRRLFAEAAERIAADNRHFFAESAERIAADNQHFFATGAEGLRHEIQLVAEGVSDTREALVREASDIREEMRRGFGETQAMIKF